MSFRVRHSLPVWLAAASLLTGSGGALARDYSNRPAELEPLHHDNDHEIIFEMEPMHPVKRSAAQTAKPAPQAASQQSDRQIEQAKKVEPAKSAKRPPATTPAAVAPAPVEAAKAQREAPKIDAPVNAVEAAQPGDVANASQALDASKPLDVAKPFDITKPADGGHMASTQSAPAAIPAESSDASATRASEAAAPPAAAAAPAADASQPIPLPLDQALNPAVGASQEKPPAQAEPVVSDKSANVAAAPQAAAEPVAEQTRPEPAAEQKAQTAPPAAAVQAAPVDAATQFASLMAKGVKGPVEVRIADRATLFLPAGRSFVADDAARDLAKLAGFDWRPAMRGLIAPTGDKLEWLAPVEVLEDGYIKSDVGLDADKLLGAFSAGLPEVNAQRVKAGQPAVELAGWLSAPALDDKHRVSACVNVMTQGGDDKYFNCEAWALGRDGAIKISLAEGGESGERLKGEARGLAETIVYDHGKTYEEIDLAADKVAPYTAGDLLTSDVSAKVAPSAPAQSEGGSLLDWVGAALPVAAVIGLGALLVLRRRSSSSDPAASARTEATTASEDAPASIFAKLLPSLHAKFGAKSREESQSVSVDVEPNASAPAEEGRGLLSKLPGLRGRSNKEAKLPVSAPVIDHADAASALQKLASRMRRSSNEETPPEKVDLSRALRGARSLPGAAPEPVAPPPTVDAQPARETVAVAPAPAAEPPAAPKAAPRESKLAELDASFGLVEPGDSEATSAAILARETLRQANG